MPPVGPRRTCSALRRYPLGLPPTPQFFGETPSTTTQMCSRAAPLDAASASVRLSMIFGTDSSVTRASYSLTSISGILTHSLSLLRNWGLVPVLHDLVRLCLRFAPPPSESPRRSLLRATPIIKGSRAAKHPVNVVRAFCPDL